MPVPKGSVMTSLGRVGLSLIVASLLPVAARSQAPDVVREPASDVAFPVRLSPPGSTGEHVLAGTAIRTKTIFRIKVYAFGLYVDADAARRTLGLYRGVPADQLARDGGIYGRLLDLRVPMTLRLVMTRDVGGKTVADSFDDALLPRVRRAAADRAMPGGEAALATFRGFFNLDEVARGTEIVFSCDTDGHLRTTVTGEPRPEVASMGLCWALFDVYLGNKPVSSDARKAIIARLPQILNGPGGRAP